MALQLSSIVIDCRDAARLAEFWAEAAGYTSAGLFNQYAVLTDPAKKGPNLILQQVEEARPGKNRVHLDWLADGEAEYQAEIQRLVGLGATSVVEQHELGIKWTVMRDPEGNEFCIAVH